MSEEELEEERRLAYVAVTRAKDKLFCLHAKERLLYGKTNSAQSSRFIGEMPDKYIEVEQERRFGYFGTGGGASVPPRGPQKPYTPPAATGMASKPTVVQPKRNANVVRFNPGDRVKNPNFGIGVVLTAQNLGSDMLYEIAFETVGTKKMMGNYAKLTPAD